MANIVTAEAIVWRDRGFSTRWIGRKLGVSQVAVWKYLKKYDAFSGKQYQPGHCDICGKDGMRDADHNHQTGQSRGLLCRACNQGLGYFQDDVKRLQQAIIYLTQYNKEV